MTQTTQASEFRAGWPVAFSAFLGIGLGLSPLPFYTLGLFRAPLSAAFGWTPEQVMTALTVTSFTVVVAGPLAGLLADRFGVRHVVLPAVVLFGLAFMALGLSNGSLPLFYLTWGVVAAFGAGTLPITWTRGVNDWFEARKGLALGLALTGTGVFGFVAPPMAAWLIGHFGWRGAYAAIGALPIVIALPVAVWGFFDRAPATGRIMDHPPVSGMSFAEVLRQWRFWLIAVALLPISFAIAGPIPNLPDMLKVAGIAPADAPGLVKYIGLSVIAGRFVGGWLLDRFWAPAVALVVLALPAVAGVMLAGPLATQGALAAVLMIGFAAGIEYDIVAFFVARYFGMRSYGSIYGVLYVCFALGSGFGPKYFARSFQTHGDFHAILVPSAAALVAGAAAFLLLGRYRYAAAPRPASQPSVTAVDSPIAGR